MTSILYILAILFVSFAIIPWVGVCVIGYIKKFLDESDRFDG